MSTRLFSALRGLIKQYLIDCSANECLIWGKWKTRLYVYHSVCILGVEVVLVIQNILSVDYSLTYSRISILPGKTYKLL